MSTSVCHFIVRCCLKRMSFFVFISLFSMCYGFLPDTSTKGTPVVLTNEHLTMFTNLLNGEIQSRRNLENIVSNLQQELISTKQTVSGNDQVVTNINVTFENRLEDMEKENKMLKDNNARLQGKYDSLYNEFKQLNLTLQMLNSVKLQTVLNWQNETAGLAQQVHLTNTRLNSVIHEANTRNQDLIGLYNKADATEKKLANDTALWHQQLVSVSNKATVTACLAHDTNFYTGHVITFNEIRADQGIIDLESFKNTGIFTCEKDGLYLISVFVQSSSANTGFKIYKNRDRIASGYISIKGTDHYQTSTAIVIEHLSVNDKVSVTADGYPIKVEGERESCMTVLQVF